MFWQANLSFDKLELLHVSSNLALIPEWNQKYEKNTFVFHIFPLKEEL